MNTFRRLGALAALACALAGCAQKPAPASDPVAAKEQSALAVLKTKYPNVITGVDVKGRTLIVYVEPNAMYSMDEDSEAAMKAEALERWKKAWTSAHPHEHGVLRMVVNDYFGRELSKSSTTV